MQKKQSKNLFGLLILVCLSLYRFSRNSQEMNEILGRLLCHYLSNSDEKCRKNRARTYVRT